MSEEELNQLKQFRDDLMEQNKFLQKDRKHIMTLCEKALWGLQKCNPVRPENPSPYNKGYQVGWKECQKLGIDLMERVIAELKQP